MRKYLLLVLLSGLAVSSFAQRKSAAPGVSSSIRVSTAVEATQSNIDLLKHMHLNVFKHKTFLITLLLSTVCDGLFQR